MNPQNTSLKIKDHSVSGEMFELQPFLHYQILKTYPQPNEDELSKYYNTDNYISHTNSSRNLLEVVYQIVRRVAIKRKLKLINQYKIDSYRLLDVGCGTGNFLSAASHNGWIITGTEPNKNARAIANKKTNNSVFDTKQLNTIKPNTFNVITLWHVLEHLPNIQKHIQRFKMLLNDKGRLVIAVPNYKSFDADYYKNYWAAYDVPRHLWHFSKKGILDLFLEYGFVIDTISPMYFDSYYVSLLSEQYKKGITNPFKAFWVGWQSNRKAKRTGDYSSLIYCFKKAN